MACAAANTAAPTLPTASAATTTSNDFLCRSELRASTASSARSDTNNFCAASVSSVAKALRQLKTSESDWRAAGATAYWVSLFARLNTLHAEIDASQRRQPALGWVASVAGAAPAHTPAQSCEQCGDIHTRARRLAQELDRKEGRRQCALAVQTSLGERLQSKLRTASEKTRSAVLSATVDSVTPELMGSIDADSGDMTSNECERFKTQRTAEADALVEKLTATPVGAVAVVGGVGGVEAAALLSAVKIVSNHSLPDRALCLDIDRSHRTHLALAACNDVAVQRFSIDAVKSELRHQDRCVQLNLPVATAPSAPMATASGSVKTAPRMGAPSVTLAPCSGNALQKWAATALGELRHAGGLCVEVANGQRAVGAAITASVCANVSHQLWHPER
jgi:hypothetical protein